MNGVARTLDVARASAPSIRVLADDGDHGGTLIRNALRARGADAELWNLRELEQLDGGDLVYRGVRQARPDLAILHHHDIDGPDLPALRQLARHTPMFNSMDGIETSIDKGLTATALRRAGVAHPATIEVSRASDVRAAVEQLARPGVPIFLKNPVGTQGIGVAGLRDASEAVAVGELVTAHGDRRLLVQAGLQLPAGEPLHDTRAFVVGGEAIAGMRRVQDAGSNELRTGLHSGARGVAHELSDAERDIAERAARGVGLHGVAGVDLLAGHVLEVNAAPGHRIAELTGIDVTGRLADHAMAQARVARTTLS